MTIQQMFLKVPWYYKAGASALLCLFLIGECHARDVQIANTALWQVHWKEAVQARKITDDSLHAAQARMDSVILLATAERLNFQKQLDAARLHKAKVIVLHDTVQGAISYDTVAVVDLPIVQACTQGLVVDSVALSGCEQFRRFAQRKFLDDSAAIKMALGKPTRSVVRAFGYGAAVGATALLLIHLFWK